MNEYLINYDKLCDFTTEVFKLAGCGAAEAEAVAGLLVDSDLRGVRSHGVIRIKQYVTKILGGGASPDAVMEVVKETSNTAVLDAKGGVGAVASIKAVALARKKAAESNLGLVSVKNSNHFGMAGHWALMLAGEDMIGFACSNTSPSMPAPGATQPALGNNPFAFAYSGEKYKEICVDMACSIVAGGKVKDLASRGKEIPMGWFLDADGKPSNDPHEMSMLLPFAGHKGFGVAFIVETLGAMLSSGALAFETNPQSDSGLPENASQFFGAIKIDAFREPSDFKKAVDASIDFQKSLKKQEGVENIKYFGEIEYENKKRIMSEGVTLPETLTDEIASVAISLGMPTEKTLFLTEKLI